MLQLDSDLDGVGATQPTTVTFVIHWDDHDHDEFGDACDNYPQVKSTDRWDATDWMAQAMPRLLSQCRNYKRALDPDGVDVRATCI
jgi:hypothetical protein